MRDGPHTDDGKDETQHTSKVVRLPRDWLGPRELLVPFGSPATSEPEQLDSAPSSVRTVPSPDAFWGEDSAAIHHAVAAPANFGAAVPAPSRSDAPWIRLAKRQPLHRLAVGVGIAVAAALAIVAAIEVVIEQPGAQNLSAGIHRTSTSNRPAQVSTVTTATATVANRAHGRPAPRRHHSPPLHHPARTGAPVQHRSSDAGSRSEHPAPSVPVSNPTPTQSAVTYSRSSPPPHYTSSSSTGSHSGSASGSGSASPSKATLRSLVVGAGTCSCH